MSHSALPVHVRLQIDRAFNLAYGHQVPGQKTTLSHLPPTGIDSHAGFIVDSPQDQPGGFIAPERDLQDSEPTHIPMSCIPAALQLLDLQPDDEEVLAVFRNAASGWTSQPLLDPIRDTSDRPEWEREPTVSRDDWRAVCAVLLEPVPAEPTNDVEEEDDDGEVERPGADPNDDDDDDNDESDEYQYEDEPFAHESSDADDDSDEYLEDQEGPGAKRRSPRKTTHATSSSSPPATGYTPGKLTPRQTLECRRVFALFFPDVSVDSKDLDGKRIMIKDITRVAKVLGEKIKAQEVSACFL